MNVSLGQTIIYVPDVQASLAFYEQAFGFERRFLSDEAEYGELESDGRVLGFASTELGGTNIEGGVLPLDPAGPPPGFEIVVTAEDVAAAVKQGVAAGATVATPPVEKPWGQTVAFLRAPDGHLVEVSSPREP